MRIENVHMNTPTEIRFTIVDGDRETVRMVFLKADSSPADTAYLMAANINRYYEIKDAGFPYDYDERKHVNEILADAAYYGTD